MCGEDCGYWHSCGALNEDWFIPFGFNYPTSIRESSVKTLLKVIGSIVIALVVLLVIVRITGFDSGECSTTPSWSCRIPGLWLRGNVVTAPVTDWSFTDKIADLRIQIRTAYLLPLSVTTDFATVNGQLYVECTYPAGVEYPHGRRWNEFIARDPHVRIKIGDQLFDGTLQLVTDPGEKQAVLDSKAKKYPPGGTGLFAPWKAPPLARAFVFRVVPS